MGGKLSSRPTTILVTAATGAGAGSAAAGALSCLEQAASRVPRDSRATAAIFFMAMRFSKG
jgi:hypothetical protein